MIRFDSRSRKDTQQTLKVHEKTETALKDAARISNLLVIVTMGAYKRLS